MTDAAPAYEPLILRLWNQSLTSLRLSLVSSEQASRRTSGKRREFLHVGPLAFSAASLAALQTWELGPRAAVAPGKRGRRALEAGFGAVATASRSGAEVLPSARIRVRLPLPFAPDAVLRLAPNAEAVVKVNLPLTRSLRLSAALRLQWTNEEFDALATGEPIRWRPQFSCRLFSSPDEGLFALSPGGLELTERCVSLGNDTELKAAAALAFPSSFPVPEGEPPLHLRVSKLCIKTRLRYGKT